MACEKGQSTVNGSLDRKTRRAGHAGDQYSSRDGDNVLDLFGGSGSTLIACEQTGRQPFLMELDALYCDVIVQRWEKFTGKKGRTSVRLGRWVVPFESLSIFGQQLQVSVVGINAVCCLPVISLSTPTLVKASIALDAVGLVVLSSSIARASVTIGWLGSRSNKRIAETVAAACFSRSWRCLLSSQTTAALS